MRRSGVGGTAAVLGSGLIAFRDGNARKSQLFMRGRVAAQVRNPHCINTVLTNTRLRLSPL